MNGKVIKPVERSSENETYRPPQSIMGYILKGLWDFGKEIFSGFYNSAIETGTEPDHAEELEKRLLTRENVKEVNGHTLKEILKENAGEVNLGARYVGSDEMFVLDNPYNQLSGLVKHLLERSKLSQQAIKDYTIAHEYGHGGTSSEIGAEADGIELLKHIFRYSNNGVARKRARNALLAEKILNRYYNGFDGEIGLNINPEVEPA